MTKFLVIAVIVLLVAVAFVTFILVKIIKDNEQSDELQREKIQRLEESLSNYEKILSDYKKYKSETQPLLDAIFNDGDFNFDSSVELLSKLRKDGEQRLKS